MTWPLACLLAAAAIAAGGPLPPSGLTCEYATGPVGIDQAQPRLSWVLRHTERHQGQTAYQIVAWMDTGKVVWDSGKVASDQSTAVRYAGAPLESGQTYRWRVRYWDAQDTASGYSKDAQFEMGLLSAAEWKGQWIAGAGQLRREFTLAERPKRGRVYVSAAGYYHLRINGQRVGDHQLDPGVSYHPVRMLYATFDVTALLHAGANAVAVTLGKGWSKAPSLLLQLNLTTASGKRVEIASDSAWKTHAGPIVSDHIYDGEVYDGRLETAGWDAPGYSDADWKPATVDTVKRGRLSAQVLPPIRIVETIVPLAMASPKPGVYVFDMGQNFSGWARICVKGERGTRVRIRYAELLDGGNLNRENLREARATDVYILRGDEEGEVYEPRFTYHGFRYVELSGLPAPPNTETVRGRVVHSSVRTIGGFTCSKPILNQLQRAVVWTLRSNLHSIPTDCPQRSERYGWLGDAHVSAEAQLFNFDMTAFYLKYLDDIRDTQSAQGGVPSFAPMFYVHSKRPDDADPVYGSGYPLIAWYLYQHTGDASILEAYYPSLRRWMERARSQTVNGIVEYNRYGDWLALQRVHGGMHGAAWTGEIYANGTPGAFMSTAFYYYSADIMRRIAEALHRADDARAYRELTASIGEALNRKFFDPRSYAFASGSQTAQALGLFLDLAPEELRVDRVLRVLVGDTIYAKNTHLETGLFGTKYLPLVLTRFGRSDLAYELVTQTTYPSWGYMLENGATTIWELWQNRTGPSMNSHNHPALASIGAWLYQALGGINPDPAGPGFRTVRIEPQVVRDLEWASASVDTVRGQVVCDWRRQDDSLRVDVTIPVGSNAEIRLPRLEWREPVVREGGAVIWRHGNYHAGVTGVDGITASGRQIVIQAGSGSYSFVLGPEVTP